MIASCTSNKDFDTEMAELLKGDVPFIHTESLYQRIAKDNNLLVLDARTRGEYEISHLPGAVHIGYQPFAGEKAERYAKDMDVVVYCSVGYRSEQVGRKLQEMGFESVYNLYGGIFDWKNKGKAVINTVGEETDNVHTYNRKWSRWLKRGVKVYE